MTHTIAEKLGGLALALEQAAGYINTQHITCARYLEDWEKHHDKVLQWFDESQTDYPRSVAATWELSFKKLKPGAARLLELLAWFAPDPIPDGLLEHKFMGEVSKLLPPAMDAEALADLFRYNLATRESAEPLFTIHRLVQDVTRRRLEQEGRAAALRQQAIEWMRGVYYGPVKEVSNWPQFDPLAAHARTLAEWADFAHHRELAGNLYWSLALWNASHGRYSLAIEQGRLAVAHLQDAIGPDHRDTLESRNDLANALHWQGKDSEAEAEHRAVLEISKRVLGVEHPQTIASRNNLGNALRAREKYAEAEAEYRAALQISKRALGDEHLDTLKVRNNLAETLRAKGQHAEAEEEHRAILDIRQSVLGSEHPDTLKSRNNVANVLDAQGKHISAEPEHRSLLERMEHVLGPEHPNIFFSCYNLSSCLEAQGKKPEALSFGRRAFEGWRKTLGESHPYTHLAHELVARLENPS